MYVIGNYSAALTSICKAIMNLEDSENQLCSVFNDDEKKNK